MIEPVTALIAIASQLVVWAVPDRSDLKHQQWVNLGLLVTVGTFPAAVHAIWVLVGSRTDIPVLSIAVLAVALAGGVAGWSHLAPPRTAGENAFFWQSLVAHAGGILAFYVISALDFVRELRLEKEIGQSREEWRKLKHKHPFPLFNRGGVVASYVATLGPVLWQDLLIAPVSFLVYARGVGDIVLPGGLLQAAVGAQEGSVLAMLLGAVELLVRAFLITTGLETWQYTVHRLIHLPGLYSALHLYHHQGTQVSLAADLSHPLDGASIGPPVVHAACHMLDMPLWFRCVAALGAYSLNCRVHGGWAEDEGGGGPTMLHQLHHWRPGQAFGLQEWLDDVLGTVPQNVGLYAPPGTKVREKAELAAGNKPASTHESTVAEQNAKPKAT